MKLFGTLDVAAVIFDVDGTLVDSNDGHAEAFERAFWEYGHYVSYQTVRRLVGMGGDKLIPTVMGRDVSADEEKKIGDRKSAIFEKDFLPGIKAFPFAAELLQAVRAKGIRTAVATSASAGELAKLLAIAGLEQFFDVKVNSDDVERSKPSPDVVEAALARLELFPDRVVMVGDTPYDVEAAAKAGVRTLAVRSGRWTEPLLSDALRVVADAEELYRLIEGG